ncbi:MAG TPA: type II toxin-antitoxin system prevent-host-death family antitoxin [Gemmatimonadales bacterium]|jgi:prevent-host-death family protein|nr:type II toxin-antitoxin system prevent-host-death family antitoxin [Gemmatimonadales bacterium]
MPRGRSKRWNLADAKAHLSELVERAARGEEIVIAFRGTPRARLVPLDASARRALRIPGQRLGRFQTGDDFNDPLPAEVLVAFLERAS